MNWRSVWLFYRDRYSFIFFNISLLLLLTSLVLLAVHFQPSDQLVVLHYNIFYGIDYLSYWYIPYIYWLILALSAALNFYFSFRIFTSDKYMSYYLNAAVCLVALFFNLYLVFIRSY